MVRLDGIAITTWSTPVARSRPRRHPSSGPTRPSQFRLRDARSHSNVVVHLRQQQLLVSGVGACGVSSCLATSPMPILLFIFGASSYLYSVGEWWWWCLGAPAHDIATIRIFEPYFVPW